jgi:hypothetical protein
MPYISLAIAPLFVALGLASSPKVSMRAWFLVVACIACLEGVAFRELGAQSSVMESLLLWCFVIALPWATSAFTLWLLRYQKHRLVVAAFFPLTYFAVFFFCLAAANVYSFKAIPGSQETPPK